MADDEWQPKTRDDWVDLFADGMLKRDQKRQDAQAEADKNKDKTGGDNDGGDQPPKRTGWNLLGGTRK